MTADVCDRCGFSQAERLFLNRDYISGEAFAIVRCSECGLVRTRFPHDWKQLGRYYGEAYYGTGMEGRRFIGIMERLIGRFRARRVQAIVRAYGRQEPGAILDVGCGRGLILQDLRRRGWVCHGTEMNETLAHRLAQAGIKIHTEAMLADAHLPDEHFDIVTLWHSLEHMAHPTQTIAEIARLLKPGGKVLLEVPNLASWQARIGGGRWFHLDAPRHLYHFTPAQLEGILRAHGLRLIASGTASLEQGFYGMAQTLLNRITTESNVLYNLLKKRLPHSRGLALAWNLAASLLGLALVIVTGLLLEGLAVAVGRGAVIYLAAEKT